MATGDASLDELPFHVELWDDRDLHVVEILAACRNVLVARAAYEAAVRESPKANLMLRIGARVVRRAWDKKG